MKKARELASLYVHVAPQDCNPPELNEVLEFLLSSRAKTWQALTALTLVYFFVTAWNLNLQHIVSPDEPRYAAATRDMMHGGEFIVPFFNTRPHLEKPVFFHWLLLVAGTIAQLFGISLDTAGFRLVPLGMGGVTVLGVYLLGRRLLNHRGAFIAAAMLMTSYQFHNVARELVIDMTLTAFLLWSWLFFHIAVGRLERGQPRCWPLLGFYLCLGCACMSKGPFLVGIFSAVPLLAYLFWTRRVKLLARAGLWWGVPLSLIMGLSWFVALKYKGYDPTGFFTVENLARFLGRKDHIHPLPFFFYLIILPQIFAPWILLLPSTVWWSLRMFRHERTGLSDGAKLLACALGIAFVIMGLSGSKRHLYLTPLLPYLALWVAWVVERAFLSEPRASASGPNRSLTVAARKSDEGGRDARGTNLLLLIGFVLFLGGIWTELFLPKAGGLPVEMVLCGVLGAVMLAVFTTAALALNRGNRAGVVWRMLAVAVCLTFGLEAVVRPIHERALNLENFYSAVSAPLAGRRLVIVGTNSNEASWYLGNKAGPIDEIFARDLQARFFDSPGTVLLVTNSFLDHHPKLWNSVLIISKELLRNRESFVLVEPNPAQPPEPAWFKDNAPQKKPGFFGDL